MIYCKKLERFVSDVVDSACVPVYETICDNCFLFKRDVIMKNMDIKHEINTKN